MSVKKKRCSRSEESLSVSQDTGYMISGNIWIEKNGKLYVDTKRATMLSLIDKLGSLAAAARSMKLGYNTAWLWVTTMNRLSPYPLVKRGCGGANGGYSILTAQGKTIVTEFNRLDYSLKETINRITNSGLNMTLNSSERMLTESTEVPDIKQIKSTFNNI